MQAGRTDLRIVYGKIIAAEDRGEPLLDANGVLLVTMDSLSDGVPVMSHEMTKEAALG